MQIKSTDLKIAIIIPCYNEALSIAAVIDDFRKSVPGSNIYVFDNNSTDDTAAIAAKNGAIVRGVKQRGKGSVVRRMFADVDADVYVMVDGDSTYDASSAPKMISKLINEQLDMVVGCREETSEQNNNYRAGHRLGNRMLTGFVQTIFNGNFTDMLSGYRVFSRRFVKSFPAASKGFETETELTIFTLELAIPYGEVATPYSERVEGAESKLSTYKDGLRIATMILRLYSSERPAYFWGGIGAVLLLVASILSVPIMIDYLATSEVPRFPSLIVATVLALGGFLSFVVGVVLRTVTRGRHESKHLAYLALPVITVDDK